MQHFEKSFYKPNNYNSWTYREKIVYPVINVCIYASLRSARGLRPSMVTTHFTNQNTTVHLFSHPLKMFLKTQSQRKYSFSQCNILKTVFQNRFYKPNNNSSSILFVVFIYFFYTFAHLQCAKTTYFALIIRR